MIHLEFRGVDELAENLRRLGLVADATIRMKALRQAAEPMRDRMSQTLSRSVSQGEHAADHIEIAAVREIDGDRVGAGESAVAVGPAKRFYYVYFLEYGTKYLSPRGEIRRAYDETCRAVPDAWAEIAWRLIREAGL